MAKQSDLLRIHAGVTVCAPRELTDSEIDEFKNLVANGGQVQRTRLKHRIKNAKLLAYIREGGKMIAVGAIKHPEASYVRQIAQKSGHPDLAGYDLELGYICVNPGLRWKGFGSRITHALAEKLDRATFATTSNPGMKHILCKEGFDKVGRPWPSAENPKSSLTLWVKRTQR